MFFVSETEAMLQLIKQCIEAAEEGSCIVVESDERFESELLPQHTSWDVRHYPPATVSIFRK